LKLSVLRYLVAFAEEKSFSRAAERCHVSQPALSVALQNLEAELGVTLIERVVGHVCLSDMGFQVVAQARRVLDEARRVELVAQRGKDPLKGEFRLGVIHTIGPYLLPGLIAAMRRTAPELSLYIEESMTALLADYLRFGTVDAVIIALPFDIPGIETRALYDEAFQVIVPKGHPWETRQQIRAEEVRGEDVLVLKAGNCFREQVLDSCPDISHAEGSLHQGHSIETIRCMVASGYGISVLPGGALSRTYQTDLVKAIPFEEPAPARRVALAWRRNGLHPQVIEAILAAVASLRDPCYRILKS
jgi:LysR family hydrogen peroxide-inducible transcriptional activator